MAKAYLKIIPLVNIENLPLSKTPVTFFIIPCNWLAKQIFLENYEPESQSGIISEIEIEEEHELHKRVQLLAVMLKAVAENRLAEDFRKKALRDNLDKICDTLIFKFQIKDLDFF